MMIEGHTAPIKKASVSTIASILEQKSGSFA